MTEYWCNPRPSGGTPARPVAADRKTSVGCQDGVLYLSSRLRDLNHTGRGKRYSDRSGVLPWKAIPAVGESRSIRVAMTRI